MILRYAGNAMKRDELEMPANAHTHTHTLTSPGRHTHTHTGSLSFSLWLSIDAFILTYRNHVSVEMASLVEVSGIQLQELSSRCSQGV